VEVSVTATDDVSGIRSGAGLPSGFTVESVRATLGEFNERIGLQLVEVALDRVVGTLPVAGNRQPYGLLHGGANAALAETLGSVAAALNAGPERAAMGVELSCTHHRAARGGLVTGVCVPLHVGRSMSTFETVITDDEGHRTCTARLTCVIRDNPPGGGPTRVNGGSPRR
jgi:1,4-dihydroxy-2-naphthoyl-CoA hydrolase